MLYIVIPCLVVILLYLYHYRDVEAGGEGVPVLQEILQTIDENTGGQIAPTPPVPGKRTLSHKPHHPSPKIFAPKAIKPAKEPVQQGIQNVSQGQTSPVAVSSQTQIPRQDNVAESAQITQKEVESEDKPGEKTPAVQESKGMVKAESGKDTKKKSSSGGRMENPKKTKSLKAVRKKDEEEKDAKGKIESESKLKEKTLAVQESKEMVKVGKKESSNSARMKKRRKEKSPIAVEKKDEEDKDAEEKDANIVINQNATKAQIAEQGSDAQRLHYSETTQNIQPKPEKEPKEKVPAVQESNEMVKVGKKKSSSGGWMKKRKKKISQKAVENKDQENQLKTTEGERKDEGRKKEKSKSRSSKRNKSGKKKKKRSGKHEKVEGEPIKVEGKDLDKSKKEREGKAAGEQDQNVGKIEFSKSQKKRKHKKGRESDKGGKVKSRRKSKSKSQKEDRKNREETGEKTAEDEKPKGAIGETGPKKREKSKSKRSKKTKSGKMKIQSRKDRLEMKGDEKNKEIKPKEEERKEAEDKKLKEGVKAPDVEDLDKKKMEEAFKPDEEKIKKLTEANASDGQPQDQKRTAASITAPYTKKDKIKTTGSKKSSKIVKHKSGPKSKGKEGKLKSKSKKERPKSRSKKGKSKGKDKKKDGANSGK